MAHDFRLVTTPPELLRSYRSIGATTDESLSTLLQSVGTRSPWLPAVTENSKTLSYGELLALVGRAASWLRSAGTRPGDVVTWQAPNWLETYVLALAIWHVGAVSNPIVSIYREHELRVILGQMKPEVVIVPENYRGCNHVELFESVLAEVACTPKAKIVLRGSAPGWHGFDEVVAGSPSAPTIMDADDAALILYTSGTTSSPKGAIHTSRTLVSPCLQINRHWGWTFEDTAYMPAPLPHVTGIMVGITSPILAGSRTILADKWDTDLAASDVIEHRVTMMSGATVFLQELTETLKSKGLLAGIRAFSCGGANISTEIIGQAEQQGISAWRCYGLTEVPCATLMSKHQPLSARSETDGAPGPGVEIQVLSDDGTVGAINAEGELLARGPQQMVGFVDTRLNEGVLDEDGWIHTGDLGRVDDDGLVTLTGRIKDIINRGGEKISARDLEEVVEGHPAVRQVAIVAGPHDRLGEVPVAFVTLRPGIPAPSQADFNAYLEAHQLPKQKLPSAWHIVSEIPATPTGKIKKFELVARLAK